MPKLSSMLQNHPSAVMGMEVEHKPASVPSVEVLTDEDVFHIPPDEGQSVPELVEEVAPGYMRACLKLARRAMSGNVNPFKEGDLPHRMALQLAHKLMPQRKWDAQLPDETPKETKRTARALKSLIKSLAEDGEVVVDSTRTGAADVSKLCEVLK
jgi:hypothetical protein